MGIEYRVKGKGYRIEKGKGLERENVRGN